MKLSEKIKNMQEALEEYGDLECICASDEEGNEYTLSSMCGVMAAFLEDGELPYRLEVINIDETDEYEDDEVQMVYCVN